MKEVKNTVDAQIKLTLAGCLNGTLMYSPDFIDRPVQLRDVLLADVEDWFIYNPMESSQLCFNKDATLEYIKAVPLVELVDTLDRMGKNPYSQMMNQTDLWSQFVDEQMDRIVGTDSER